MEEEGKYIYCIIGTNQERNFGPIGIGGRGDEVLTIGYEDLSMVVSNFPLNKLVINRENMIMHEKVIEEVMKEFGSVLPVRFYTVASSADEIRKLLNYRYREFKCALKDMENKIELGVKGIWKNMYAILKEIKEENGVIKSFKNNFEKTEELESVPKKKVIENLVKNALKKKKEIQTDEIVEPLRKTYCDMILNNTMFDEMFMNAAFLVDKGREKEFDSIMGDLSEKYKYRINFIYTGPLPPYNFVNITIYSESQNI